jgi:hypothetical protein
MSSPLTITIPIKNRHGQVVDEKEVVLYRGLLAKAHSEGLRRINTVLIQVPQEANDFTAICRAEVETDKGTFSGIGDASPANCSPIMTACLIRLCETRAKARALRDAVNIGVVAFEELGDLSADLDKPATNVRRLDEPNRLRLRSNDRMSDAQRRLLFRLIVGEGHEPSSAPNVLMGLAEVDDLAAISKGHASSLIDALKNGGGSNGA